MPVICKNCGLIGEYRTEKKENNLIAFCKGCNHFIQNLPYSPPSLHFGKYKGCIIQNIEDLGYLEWVLNNVRLSELNKAAVLKQINSLRLTHV